MVKYTVEIWEPAVNGPKKIFEIESVHNNLTDDEVKKIAIRRANIFWPSNTGILIKILAKEIT